MVHAYGARLGSVVAYATVGLSNPAMLPMDPTGVTGATDDAGDSEPGAAASTGNRPATRYGQPGSRNDAAARRRRGGEPRRGRGRGEGATLFATAAGVPGTTTTRRGGRRRRPDRGAGGGFSGSATPVGAAARVCVRDAVRASLRSRYPDGDLPGPAADAEHGVVADERTAGFRAMTTDNNDTDSTTDDDADAPTDGEPTESDELRPRRRPPGGGLGPEPEPIEPAAPEEFGLVQAWWGDGREDHRGGGWGSGPRATATASTCSSS